jgi:hypothetical protein
VNLNHIRIFVQSLLMVWGLVLIMPPAAGAQREAPADGPGTVRWFGLLTEDAAAARTFYVDLFGWQTERTSSGGYIALHDGQPLAGITQIGRSVPEIDESTWLVGVNALGFEPVLAGGIANRNTFEKLATVERDRIRQ